MEFIMKKIGRFFATVECVLVGGVLSSLILTGSDTWKYYLVLILLMNSYRSVNRDL